MINEWRIGTEIEIERKENNAKIKQVQEKRNWLRIGRGKEGK